MNDVTDEEKMGLLNLPFEMLEKIGDYLDCKSSLNLRLTNSVLKKLIDTYVGINLELCGSSGMYKSEQLNFISEICISKVTAKNMQLNVDDKGVRSYLCKDYSFDDIFCFPHFLRTVELKGTINVQFVFDVLTKCHNLESISVMIGDDNFELEGDLFPLLLRKDFKEEFDVKSTDISTWLPILYQRNDIFRQIKLKRLKKMEIIFLNLNFLNVMLLLKCVGSEILERSVLIVVEDYEFTELDYFYAMMIITDFFLVHVGTLKDITISLNLNSSNPNHVVDLGVSQALNRQMKLLEYLENEDAVNNKTKLMNRLLEKFTTIGTISRLTYLNVAAVPNFLWSCWLALIKNLRLVTLRMRGLSNYEIVKNCEFIRNSNNTLKRLRIDLSTANEFDLVGIEKYAHLEEIYLFNQSNSQNGDIIYNNSTFEPNLRNVKLIPAKLKSLLLVNVAVTSEDLNIMLSNQKLLINLVILHLPTLNPENGTDCNCLQKIFRMRYLQSCLIQNFQCKTRRSYGKIVQMIELQMGPSESSVPLSMLTLNIVSKEAFCPYHWDEENNFPRNLLKSITFNDLDPYIF